MKAVYIHRYGGPEEMVFGELDDPVPGKNEVLIRVAAAAVNPVDWKIREGRLKIITGKNFPMIMGVELSGTGCFPGRKCYRPKARRPGFCWVESPGRCLCRACVG